MRTHSPSRRRFLRSMSLTATTALAGPYGRHILREVTPGTWPVRLGGPSFAQSEDPAVIAAWHREQGYGAAYCPPASLDDAARLREIERAFEEHDVVIAEVGRWVNLMDADPIERKKNLQTVIEGLALADEVGAKCAVDIAGSFNAEVWFGPHPDNLSPSFFDAAVENARTIIDSVRPRRARFCYEMMGWTMPETPERYLDMLKAIDRPAFGVHLDPCNLINSPEKFYDNARVIDHCFDLLADQIVSCHAKDLEWVVEMNVHFREVRPGAGAIDYRTYLQRLAMLPQQPPLMLEHLDTESEYAEASRSVTATGEGVGVTFAPSRLPANSIR